MTTLYNKEILRLAISIPLTERLDAPDATVVKTSRICGSRVTADFIFDGDRIAGYGQEVKACALGQASCSIFGRHIIGQTLASLQPVADQVLAMLKEGAAPPAGDWAEYTVLAPAREHKSRHASIMLPFDAALEVLASVERQADTG